MTENRSIDRNAVTAGVAGVVGGGALMIPTPDAGEAGFAVLNACSVIAFVLLMVAVAGLARAGLTGRGWLARIGVAGALVGLAGYAAVEVAARYGPGAGDTLHPITVPLLAVSMIVTGIAVIRAGSWRGWPRITPLLCGVVPFAVELPAFILFGANAAAIAITWAAWALLGAALLITAARPQYRVGRGSDIGRDAYLDRRSQATNA
jgi:hypothetical protein